MADDIIVTSCAIHELKEMLSKSVEKNRPKMKLSQAKITSHAEYIVTIDGTTLGNVDKYVYLMHNIEIGKKNQITEIQRR